MFSGNEKVSARQIYRNYAAGGIAISAFLIPLSVRGAICSGIALALVLVCLLLAFSAAVPAPSEPYLKAVSYFYFWLVGTMAARMTGMLVQEYLLAGVPLWIVLGWFYLICYYNLYKGLECRLRVGEVLFVLFLVLLILPGILMWGELDFGNLKEIRWSLDRTQARLGYELFCWLGVIHGSWYLQEHTAEPGGESPGASGAAESPALSGTASEPKYPGFSRAVFHVGLTLVAVAAFLAAFAICIYGKFGSTGLIYPLGSAMTLARFPGGVIGRLDALFVFSWVIGLFLLCSALFAPLQAGEPTARGKMLSLAAMIASFAFALSPECLEWGQLLLYRAAVPLELLLLLWSALRPHQRKKAGAACLCLLLCLFLSGCGAQELEKQSQVVSIGVDVGEERTFRVTLGFGAASPEERAEPFGAEADSLSDAKDQYWEKEQKNLDFNHLKTFYFSEELLASGDFETLLEELQLDTAYSRGTSVYAALGSPADEASKEDQPEDGAPLHRLLNAHFNETACELPSVTADGLYKGTLSWPY